jgi:hypothetical protein
LALRIAFRFCVCFFAFTTLYLAVGHLASLLQFSGTIPERIADAVFAPYEWATRRLFGSVVYVTFAGFVAYMTTAVIAAAIGTIIWSLVDRRRAHYRRMHAGLRIYLRYLLAAVALSYGMAKVIPVQFAPPSLVALVTPLGEFTRMRLLWHFMGTSSLYTVFTGLVEVGGGLLLLSRRTTTLGALVLAAAFTNVALLNFGYEVGVQLNSTIYALMALVLLAPDARRLANLFFFNKTVAPADLGVPPVGAGARWLGRVVKAAVIVALLVVNIRGAYLRRNNRDPLPVVYGVYEVDEFARDGAAVPPGDRARWHRLVIAERGQAAIQWTAGGPVQSYQLKDDTAASLLTLTGRGADRREVTLRYTREGAGLLLVAGRVGDDTIQARLRAVDHTKFPLRQHLWGPR